MFSLINSCKRKFDQHYNNNTEAQFPQPGLGDAINIYYQMNPQFWFTGSSTNSGSDPGSSSRSSFPGYGKTGLEETSAEESEAVDELIEILVECLKRADMKTREVLLRKCFFEIEKEMPLERFLVERIKQSKILPILLDKAQDHHGDHHSNSRDIVKNDETGHEDRQTNHVLFDARQVDLSSGDEGSEKLERFKVKTIHVGEVVKQEGQ